MPETAFLDALRAYLAGLAGPAAIIPTPVLLGYTEPAAADELPAVVLSLEAVQRLGAGLGERAMLVSGSALPWAVSIDLANPVLAEEPGFNLLSPDRRTLTLPHGGLKRADGSSGALGPADLSVRVGATIFGVVAGAPVGNQVQAQADIGQLRFGNPLPGAGTLQASYVLGQWERRVTPIAGQVRIDLDAADGVAAAGWRESVLGALVQAAGGTVGAAGTVRGLRKLALAQIGPVLGTDAAHASARRRSALLAFEYEHEINRPDSSGGVIQRVAINTTIDASPDQPTQVP